MNPEKTSLETIIAYFIIAAGIVWSIWKTLPPFLTWWDNRKKAKREQIKIDRSESAEFRKAELEHDIKLEELLDSKFKEFIRMQDEEILDLRGNVIALKAEIKSRDEVEEQKKPLYLQKLLMLRENQRELKMLEAEVLKLENAAAFQKIALEHIKFLKTQMEEHEKLLT